MATTPEGQKAARWLALTAIVILGGILWYLAPIVFPVFRWTEFDPAKINAPEQTKQQVSLQLRFAPRGPGDPLPWQILSMSPSWDDIADPDESEKDTLVRISFVSDKTGEKPGELFISDNTYKDRYWKAKGWRLPPGTFGKNAKRPVVLVDMFTFEKMEMGAAQSFDFAISEGKYQNDDEWEDRMDGYRKPTSPE